MGMLWRGKTNDLFLTQRKSINEWVNVWGSVTLHITNKVEIHPLS